MVNGDDFPEVETEEQLQELLEEVVDSATEWGYREDGTTYWYDEVTDTVVIKNPPGIGGTTYRPNAGGPLVRQPDLVEGLGLVGCGHRVRVAGCEDIQARGGGRGVQRRSWIV